MGKSLLNKIKVTPLKIIKSPLGNVMHALKKKELKWLPNENFNSGIKKTIDWYIKNEDWWRKIQKNNYKQERLGLNEL